MDMQKEGSEPYVKLDLLQIYDPRVIHYEERKLY